MTHFAGWAWCRAAILVLGATVLGSLLDGPHPFQIGAVFATLACLTGLGLRSLAALLMVFGFRLSFPPFAWPFYWCCFAPAVWLWRDRPRSGGVARDAIGRGGWVWEALGVGFAMCWLTTPFMRAGYGAWGIAAHAIMGLSVGFQVIGIATCLRFTRDWAAPVAVLLSALGAGLVESVPPTLAHWMVLPLYLPAAATPLAQWASYVGPFGVSALLYLVNFLFWADRTRRGLARWLAPAIGAVCLASAWSGGRALAEAIDVRPLPFRALIVQPNLPPENHRIEPPWTSLDRLTRTALERCPGADLIIWPETILSPSPWPIDGGGAGGEATGEQPLPADALTLDEFRRRALPRYGRPCLVGVVLVISEPVKRYGVTVHEGRLYNGACLISPFGETQAHFKMALCPVREWLPEWLDTPWVRDLLASAFQVWAVFRPGREYAPLELKGGRGQTVRVGASICYEMFFPHLPQYRPANHPVAVVHLTNNAWSAEYRDFARYQLWACQYRAIETRSWQIIASTFSGSAIIDPRGRVREFLPSRPGVLLAGEDGSDGEDPP